MPVATFSYTGTPYCKNAANPSATLNAGSTTGTFSSTAGLVFLSTSTGQINLSTSTAGTYTVTNTIAVTGGCGIQTATATITITAVPTANISYAGTPFCRSLATAQPVTLSGTGVFGGGTYSSTTGLTIDGSTGAITPSTSTAGTYTVTYTSPASGGCSSVVVTNTVTITDIPTATISYIGTPFCKSVGTAQSVTRTGTGAFTVGTYSSTTGLILDPSTGAINPSTSTAGTYTVTYTIQASGGCAAVPVTTSVTITAVPVATFNYTGTPYCQTSANPTATLGVGATAGTFSSTSGLVFVSTSTGQINLSASTPGTYTVTNTIAASNGCAAVTSTSTITITALPVATFSYTGTPYCKNTTNPLPSFTGGGVAGTFSSTQGLDFVNTSTGEINLGTSTVGTFTVTNIIAAAGGCGVITSTTIVTVTAVPTIYSIAGTNTCQGLSTGTINLNNSVTGVTYQLLLSNGTIVQSPIPGTGNSLSWINIPANTYTVQATNNSTRCKSFTSNYIVASNTAPAPPTITPLNPTICLGSGTPLTASGLYPNVIISENFSDGGTAPGWQQSNTSTNNTGLSSVNASQNSSTVDWAILNSPSAYLFGTTNYNFQSPDNSKFLMTNHAAQSISVPYATTFVYTPAFSTQGMASAAVKFTHTLKLNASNNAAQPDEANIEASVGSINGPWTRIKTYNSNNVPSLQVGAPNAFVLDSAMLGSSFLNQNNVYFRFVYKAKYRGWWWAMDDVSISVAPQVSYTWSPTNNLFTDAAYTVPYAGGATPTVYAKPTVTSSYLVTTNITSANGCPANTTVAVTVNTPAAITDQPAPTIGCVGTSQTITMAVTGSFITYQWEVSTNGGSTWSNVTGQTSRDLTIANPTAVFASYLYRNKVSSPVPCPANLVSNIISLKLKHVWTGGTDTSWMTGSNWSDGAPPTLECDDVYILGNRTFQPTLSTGTALIKNIIIQSGAYLTVNNVGVLGIAGTITNAGTFDLLAGTLLLNGSTNQVIEGVVFKEKTIWRLQINNNINIIGSDTLKISGSLGFETLASNKIFNAGTKNVSLLSTQFYTANVNEIKNGNSVLGNNFTVERFISTGVIHGKSWQLLGTAVTGQSVLNAWQEGKVLRPGLGTNIPSDIANSSFDGPALFSSMKVYNSVTNVYDGIPNTLIDIGNPKGYYIFVRGDRSVVAFNAPPNKTTLRSTGTLNTGNSLPNVNVLPGAFATVGNPYPSTIDLRKLYADLSSFLNFDIYVWDPSFLGGAHGLGGYRTLTYLNGNYEAVPAGGFYSTISNFIQSGQAFFVRSKGSAGNVIFKESYKINTSSLVTRSQQGQIPIIRTTLNGGLNGTPQIMLDGALAIFGDEYSNDLNFEDANKFTNAGMVNTGFVRSGRTLAVERRRMPTETDTLHISFTGVRQLAYTWNINVENIDAPGLQAWLWDKFLNTKTALPNSNATDINFSVDNNAASTAADRFKIVFTQAIILPVKIVSANAIRLADKSISVIWNVENENNVSLYTIERSANGTTFNSLGIQPPVFNNGSNGLYNFRDAQPLLGDNYYRVKVVSTDGRIQYSNIIKVEALAGPSVVSVQPNPVLNKEMNLVFSYKPNGKYDLSLTNSIGQTVYKGQVIISSNNETRKIRLVNVEAAGVYQLTIIGPDGSNIIQRIMIQ